MSTLRVLCRPSGVATSTAYLQAFRGWRDPDSNRGHHDFQSLRPRRREARNPWKQAVPARRARDGDVSNLQVYRRDSGDGWPPIPLLSARCLGRVLGRPGRRPRGPAPRRAVPLRNRRPEIAASVRRLNSAALARTLRREERSSRGEGDRAVSELHGRGSRRRSVPQVQPARAASWLAVFGGRRERPGPVPRWQHRAGRSST
jgi:hypothetical protein